MLHTMIIVFLLIGTMFYLKECANKEVSETIKKVENLTNTENIKNIKKFMLLPL